MQDALQLYAFSIMRLTPIYPWAFSNWNASRWRMCFLLLCMIYTRSASPLVSSALLWRCCFLLRDPGTALSTAILNGPIWTGVYLLSGTSAAVFVQTLRVCVRSWPSRFERTLWGLGGLDRAQTQGLVVLLWTAVRRTDRRSLITNDTVYITAYASFGASRDSCADHRV